MRGTLPPLFSPCPWSTPPSAPRMSLAEQSDGNTSQDSVNDTTFIVDERDTAPNILSLSMVNSTISTQLASLRSLSCPDTDLLPRPVCHQLPLPALHLELEGLHLEDSLEREVDSEMSRVGPEGGNTDG